MELKIQQIEGLYNATIEIVQRCVPYAWVKRLELSESANFAYTLTCMDQLSFKLDNLMTFGCQISRGGLIIFQEPLASLRATLLGRQKRRDESAGN